MPVDLHQRLSEFSYGYGITREVERNLKSIGLRPTPFLPSLIQEAKFGFDVHYDRPGVPLLLQFKLGEAVQRFRRSDKTKPIPPLQRPFWRFSVDTAEADGQFDLLLKAEQAGAEVYYVAPRFASWEAYVVAFQNEIVLDRSLLISPAKIDNALAGKGEPDGWHKIVYDETDVFVCSESVRLKEVTAGEMAHEVFHRIIQGGQRMDVTLDHAYAGLARRREIRRRDVGADTDGQYEFGSAPPRELAPSPQRVEAERAERLEALRVRAESKTDATFAAFGLETWASGAQLIAVTVEK